MFFTFIKQLNKVSEKSPSAKLFSDFSVSPPPPLAAKIREAGPRSFVDVPVLNY